MSLTTQIERRSAFPGLALVVFAWFALLSVPAAANELDVADHRGIQELIFRARSLADDLAAAISHPPDSYSLEAAGRDEAVLQQRCRLRLAGDLDDVSNGLDRIGGLVGMATGLTDEAQRPLVHRVLIADASGFLSKLRLRQEMLELTLRQCPQDPTAMAKGRDISRIHRDSVSLVRSIIEKLGASHLSR
jgi:hypothetical protein